PLDPTLSALPAPSRQARSVPCLDPRERIPPVIRFASGGTLRRRASFGRLQEVRMSGTNRLIVVLAASVIGASCSSGSTSPNTGLAHLRVVNAATSGGAVSVYVDGGQVTTGIAPATSSAALAVAPGSRTIELRTTGGLGFTRSIVFADNADIVT